MSTVDIGINLTLKDVERTPDGLWRVARVIHGKMLEVLGDDQRKVLEQAHKMFDERLRWENEQAQRGHPQTDLKREIGPPELC